MFNSRSFNSEIKYLMENYKATFIVALLAYFIAYGFELTHFTLSIDEEYFDNFEGTLSFGRWGHALLRNYILPEPYTPFFTLAISLITLSITAAVSARIIGLVGVSAISFAMFIVGLPQIAHQLSFANQTDTVSIAFLFSAISVYFTRKINITEFIFLCLCLVIPASIYQSVLFYSVSLMLLSLTLSVYYGKDDMRSALKRLTYMFSAMVVAVIVNTVMAKLMQHYFKVPSTDYLTNMIAWGKNDTFYLISQLIRMAKDSLTFNNYIGLNGFSLTLIPLFILLVKFTKTSTSKMLFAFFVLASLLSVFILPALTGTELSPRTSTQFPVVFAGLSAITVMLCGGRILPITLALLVLISGSATSNKLFYSDYMARKADEINAERMMSIIYNKYPNFDSSKNPVYFYGSFSPVNKWYINHTDVFGASFFAWDGGNNKRIYGFFSISNIADLKLPNSEEKNNSIKYAKAMPAWPNSNAIQMNDGVVIIKLGDKLSPYNW